MSVGVAGDLQLQPGHVEIREHGIILTAVIVERKLQRVRQISVLLFAPRLLGSHLETEWVFIGPCGKCVAGNFRNLLEDLRRREDCRYFVQ